MQCPIDKTEMEKGIIRIGPWQTRWNEYPIRFGLIKNHGKNAEMFSYRCPKCGKVELATEV